MEDEGVERYDPADEPDAVDTALIDVLRSRDGIVTIVELKSGVRLAVRDITWAYDHLDDRAHVTTNVSPGRADLSLDTFSTDEVKTVSDPTSDAVLWESSAPDP